MSPNKRPIGTQFRPVRARPAARVVGVKMRPSSSCATTPPATARRRARRWLVAVACGACAWPALSTELPAATLRRALDLAEQAARAVAPRGARVSASAGALDARLQLAPCARVEPHLAAGQPAWGRTRVGLRCVEGAAWNVFLPVHVQVHARALIARQPLPGGTRVAEDLLEMAEIDWAAAAGAPFTQAAELAGRVLVRPLAAGQAPRAADLQPRQWFASGQPVSVVASGGGFSIRTEGQALNPGVEGQLVRVRTESGRVLVGRPVGEGLVEVRL